MVMRSPFEKASSVTELRGWATILVRLRVKDGGRGRREKEAKEKQNLTQEMRKQVIFYPEVNKKKKIRNT